MSNKKRVLSLFLVLMIAATAVPWSCVTVSSSYNGVLQFDTQGKFTVMQVTDIQDDESVATGTIELLNRALARYSPDLVVLTGDNVSGNTSKSEFLQSLDQFLAPLTTLAQSSPSHSATMMTRAIWLSARIQKPNSTTTIGQRAATTLSTTTWKPSTASATARYQSIQTARQAGRPRFKSF